MKKTIFSFMLLLLIFISKAGEVLIIDDSTERFVWHEKYVEVYSDQTGQRTFLQIDSVHKIGSFKQAAKAGINFKGKGENFWAHLQIENQSVHHTTWFFELFDFHIDQYEIYVLHEDSLRYHFYGGDSLFFSERTVKHKNFIHEINLDRGKIYDVYIKAKNKQAGSVIGVIRTFDHLLEYSNNEYLLLSIFYGIICLLGVYSFFIFLSTHNSMYFYFAGYVFSMGLCSLANDGLGYQFIWGDSVRFNNLSQAISIVLFMVFSLLYSSRFLQIKKISSLFYNTIRALLMIRCLVFITGYFLYEPLLHLYEFDIVILCYIFFLGIYSYVKGFKAARFFVLAYSVFFIGFTLTLLIILGLVEGSFITVYGLNFGSVFQLMLLSLAVADRIRIIAKENVDAQHEIIIQLKEKEALRDKVTRELEEKVKERTKELEYKNQQLDAFVYKASHDIKGPLKSILGLAKLGKLDIKDTSAQEYFEHIEKSSLRLDSLLNDLLQIAKLKNKQITLSQINFEKVLNEVKESFINIPQFNEFNIELSIKQDRDFYSDEKMIYSIFQNMIENAFKYRDPNKEHCNLVVRIEVDRKKSVIEFVDNGLGINKDLKDKVFDMFFRASDVSGGTGLGLYLVKMAVEKIGGRIHLETELNMGSAFRIVI